MMWTRMDTIKYNKAFNKAKDIVYENFGDSIAKDTRCIVTTMVALKILEKK